MTYHHIRTPAQHLTPGADEERANCDGRWSVFDVLIQPHLGDDVAAAAEEARALCNACPLRATCWRDNADEEWVQTIRDHAAPKRPRRTVAACGTESGYTRHRRQLGEEACDACKAAKAEAGRRRQKAREAAA